MDIEQMKKDLGGGNVFPIGEENVAFAKYFTGECYLNMLTTERVPVGLVTFAPGTINAYHIHHKGGQILLVTGGRGWYQEEGKPARSLELNEDEQILMKGYNLLTAKPMIYVANLDDEGIMDPDSCAYYNQVKEYAQKFNLDKDLIVLELGSSVFYNPLHKPCLLYTSPSPRDCS